MSAHEPRLLHAWVLEQDRVWVDISGNEHELSAMETSYLSTVKAFVLRKWGGWMSAYEKAYGLPEEISADPAATRTWLLARPFMRALAAEIAVRDAAERAAAEQIAQQWRERSAAAPRGDLADILGRPRSHEG